MTAPKLGDPVTDDGLVLALDGGVEAFGVDVTAGEVEVEVDVAGGGPFDQADLTAAPVVAAEAVVVVVVVD